MCNNQEAIAISIKKVANNVEYEIAFSSIGVLSDCDCATTSMT